MPILSFTLSRYLVHSLSIISLTAFTLACGASRATLPDPATDISSTSTVKGKQTVVLAGG